MNILATSAAEGEATARPSSSLLLVVTGMSGGGKSVALKTLEDLGFYCVDNLPAELLPEFVRAAAHPERAEQKLAVGIDMRNRGDLGNLPEWLSAVGAMGLEPRLVFFDAADAALLRRFSETRRRHPLTHLGLALADAISLERQALKPLRSLADVVVDTSELNVHQLRHRVITDLGLTLASSLSLLFASFAYRRGLPPDADFVFDARSLPNPHWDPRLKPLSGRDPQVREYFLGEPLMDEYLTQVSGFLDTWLPRMQSNTRSYVTVAFGCSGGRHRSVYLAEALAERARQTGWTDVATFHRELD